MDELNELMQIEQYTSSFDNMPNEVIIRILAQADLTTIKMVSLVNKSLRSLIADILFGFISIENTSGLQANQTYFKLTKRSVRNLHISYPKTIVQANIARRCIPFSQMTRLQTLHINARELLINMDAVAEMEADKEAKYVKYNLIDYIPYSSHVKELTLVVNSLNDFHYLKFSIPQLVSKFTKRLTLIIVKSDDSTVDRYVAMDFTQPHQFERVILCDIRSSVVFLRTAYEDADNSGTLREVSFVRGLQLLRETYYSEAFVVNESD
ncbi:hypothetical protein E3P99_00391 [Wallemia hederae]|uniref:F-box domain-containing protein n=1 Tax=Wallemia hederae TaxID=1540922 RepID=A0A4T0FVL7_9BASI|nr:hypothetical protein E3P99_00391 [Wallemia hederae]